MNNNGHMRRDAAGDRCGPRVYSLRQIRISYEGQDEQIVVKPPNLSTRGMFINTNRCFPEGAVLNLQFELLLTNAGIRTRGEVRYCQPGVGVGVEFIGLTPEAARLIEREIKLSCGRAPRTQSKHKLEQAVARSRGKRSR